MESQTLRTRALLLLAGVTIAMAGCAPRDADSAPADTTNPARSEPATRAPMRALAGRAGHSTQAQASMG
jgi:hypothetical protein